MHNYHNILDAYSSYKKQRAKLQKKSRRAHYFIYKEKKKKKNIILDVYFVQNFGYNIGDSKCKFSWFLGILSVAILCATNFFFFFYLCGVYYYCVIVPHLYLLRGRIKGYTPTFLTPIPLTNVLVLKVTLL